MKKRSPAAVLLLPFVTLGIYCIYWLYATRKELVARSGHPKSIPPVSLLFLPLIGVFLFMVVMFAISASSNDSSTAFTLVSIVTIISGMIGLLSFLLLPLWWFWRYCHVASEQTGSMDFAQMYVLYVVITWVCGLLPVWMLIVQIDLNKLIDRDAAHAHHGSGHHPAHHESHEHHPAPGI